MTDHRRRVRRSLGERFELWLVRSFVWTHGAADLEPPPPVPAEPAAEQRAGIVRAVLTVTGLVLPVVVAAALIPLRDSIAGSTAALVLVLPVVAVAAVADRVAAVVAAASAALAYDVLLTQPYYSFTIDAADDIEAALVLGCIGAVVGTFVSREIQARSRSSRRALEIAALAEATQALSSGDTDRLVEACTTGIEELFDLVSCDWAPGFHGTIQHEMTRQGDISAWTRPELPAGYLEVPVAHAGHQLGRLILRGRGAGPVSTEERRTIVAIADILGAGVAASS